MLSLFFVFGTIQNATERHVYLNSFSTQPQSAKYGMNRFSSLSPEEFRGRINLEFCSIAVMQLACQSTNCVFLPGQHHLPSFKCNLTRNWLDISLLYMFSIWSGRWILCVLDRFVPASNPRACSAISWIQNQGAAGQIWLEGPSGGGACTEPASSKMEHRTQRDVFLPPPPPKSPKTNLNQLLLF